MSGLLDRIIMPELLCKDYYVRIIMSGLLCQAGYVRLIMSGLLDRIIM